MSSSQSHQRLARSTKSGADHAETRNGATASIALQRDLADPPHTGEETDENTRVTPAVVTNPNLEVKLYGPDAKVIRAATHEQRTDLWNGMTTSPSAVTVRDRRNFLDLTEAARLRWIVRTNAIHTLHPVVKLADGRLIVGDRQITTHGEFLSVEIAFTGMRWYIGSREGRRAHRGGQSQPAHGGRGWPRDAHSGRRPRHRGIGQPVERGAVRVSNASLRSECVGQCLHEGADGRDVTVL